MGTPLHGERTKSRSTATIDSSDLSAIPEDRPRPIAPTARLTLLCALTIFLSAFLLFQVQPLITKMILPWFGGVAAVWTVCLVFFQGVLLVGYFYAHVLTTRFSPRTQARIHTALLAVSLLALPILPKNSFKPTRPDAPAWHILALLTVTVGLPYFVLSSISPLLQAWYARVRSWAAPYRFYALSNAGSMLALLSYPVVVEPFVATTRQAISWSVEYAAVVVLCAALAVAVAPRGARDVADRFADAPASPSLKTKLTWVALAACGSALLLAVTNHISQNIASVPFLWVIPLSLYLLSFVLCFDARHWYKRDFFCDSLGSRLAGWPTGSIHRSRSFQ